MHSKGKGGEHMHVRELTDMDIPNCLYSSMVFFSPTLKPSVLEAVRSSLWWSAMVFSCSWYGGVRVLYISQDALEVVSSN